MINYAKRMNKEIVIENPDKILPWIGGPYMAAGILIGVILLIGFTPDLLFVNYFFEALFLFLFFFSYKNRYQAYKAEPNLKITAYFWIELAIHGFFIAAATVQSTLNVWLSISEEGLTYRHKYFVITLMIVILHLVYFCIDYYATEKAAIVKSCKRMKKRK